MCCIIMHNNILVMDRFLKSFQATLLAHMASLECMKPECS